MSNQLERKLPPPIPEEARREAPPRRPREREVMVDLGEARDRAIEEIKRAGNAELLEQIAKKKIERVRTDIGLSEESVEQVAARTSFWQRSRDIFQRTMVITREAVDALLGKERKETGLTASAVETVASLEHPSRNEDAGFVDAEKGVAAIFDGMGGHEAGEAASRTALEVLQAEIDKIPSLGEKKEIETALERMLQLMREQMIQRGQELGVKSMGTTAEILKAWKDKDGKRMITVGGVGDSRVYRLREGELEKVSRDDSPLTVLIESGLVPDDQKLDAVITMEDVRKKSKEYPGLRFVELVLISKKTNAVTVGEIRNIVSQSISSDREETIKPNILTLDVKEGDEFILVSDGVSDNLLDSEMEKIARYHKGDPKSIAAELKRAALSRSEEKKTKPRDQRHPRAKVDDITAIAVRV